MHRLARFILALALIIIVVGIYLNFTSMHTNEQPFDSDQWKGLSNQSMLNDPGCARGGMALSVMRSGLLTDLPQSEVISLLGEAETSQPTELRYGLGQCHWDWKHSSLVVTFNAKGLVSQTTIELESPGNGQH